MLRLFLFIFAIYAYCIMKGDALIMILFMILALMVIILTGLTILAISIGGSVAVVLFGDVIVCIVIILFIIKRIIFRRKK